MREIEAKRTRFSKTFDLGNGQRRLEVGKLPMHFERGGKLLDIDLTPEFDGVRKHHALRNCPYSLRVADDRPAYFYNSLNGKSVEVELVTATGKPLVEGGLFKWGEVGRDTDYVIQPLPVGCATLLILHGPAAPRTWSWRIGGDIGLIRPLVGKDGAGRMLELIENRDAKAGTITVEWTGRTLNRSDLRRKKRAEWTDAVTWPVLIDPTVNENISASADDASSGWENGTAFYKFQSNTSFMLLGNTLTGGVNYSYQVGFRFQTVAVPAGATIDSATLTIRAGSITGTPNVVFHGNDVDDATAWADPGNRVHNITRTTASQVVSSWTPNADNAVDVTSIVAELVARAGWVSNNDLAIAGFRNGGTGADNFLNVVGLEHATLTEARLAIDYTEAGGTVDAAWSAAGSGTASGTAASVAASAAGAAGTGAATGSGAAIAASVFAASGAGTAAGVAASIAAATGLAQGSGDVAAVAPEPEPVPVVTFPPVGGGGGFGPGYRPDKQRFRIRKDKSKPKVITVRIGDWPEDPQIILAREEESERAAFYRQLSQRKDPEIIGAVDEEEQFLMAILAAAA